MWVEDGRVVAWSWLKDGGRLEHDVHPEHVHLLDEILAEPTATLAFALEDDEPMRTALARHGFTEPGETLRFFVRDLPAPPDLLPLPDGFRYRTVDTPDLAERVAIRRDVWAPSRVTESSYAGVRAAWPYRASLDCVIETTDGRFAAYALLWPGDENSVGEPNPSVSRGAGDAASVPLFAHTPRFDGTTSGRRPLSTA